MHPFFSCWWTNLPLLSVSTQEADMTQLTATLLAVFIAVEAFVPGGVLGLL